MWQVKYWRIGNDITAFVEEPFICIIRIFPCRFVVNILIIVCFILRHFERNRELNRVFQQCLPSCSLNLRDFVITLVKLVKITITLPVCRTCNRFALFEKSFVLTLFACKALRLFYKFDLKFDSGDCGFAITFLIHLCAEELIQ